MSLSPRTETAFKKYPSPAKKTHDMVGAPGFEDVQDKPVVHALTVFEFFGVEKSVIQLFAEFGFNLAQNFFNLGTLDIVSHHQDINMSRGRSIYENTGEKNQAQSFA